MQTIPAWLQQAFADWLTRRLYLDGGGNYRSRPSRQVASHNLRLKRLYPDNQDFHQAAQIWLALWDVVPTARLAPRNYSGGPRRDQYGDRLVNR